MPLRNAFLATLVLAIPISAQNTVAFDSPYQVRYSTNLAVGESFVYISNSGANGASLLGPGAGAAGNICVNIYAMAPDEQLVSCCSCLVTPNGLVRLAVKRDLLSNTLTGAGLSEAVVKLISTLAGPNGSGSSCASTAALVGQTRAVSGLLAWGTTIHELPAGGYTVNETPFVPATLNPDEVASLGGRCASILGNGSGHGICSACPGSSCTLAVSCPSLASLPVQIPITGGTAPYTCSATGLPAGTSLNGCTIVGTPPTPPYSFTINVTDSSSPACVATTQCNASVIPSTLTATCQSFCAPPGVPITPVQTPPATGGTPPYTYTAPSLTTTTSLTMAASTGVISGTVSAPVGSYPYTVTVKDSSPSQLTATSQTCTVSVGPGPTVSCPLLQSRRGPPCITIPINPVYVPITGGTPPYTCTTTGLPTALHMSSDCQMTGTAAMPVAQCEANPTLTYTITVTDSSPQICSAPTTIQCTTPLVCDP